MKIKIFKYFLILILVVINNILIAQTTNLSVNEIAQILSIATQMKMTPQELATYAKSKGIANTDINFLVQKYNPNNANSNLDLKLGTNNQNPNLTQGVQEIKQDGTEKGIELTKEERKIFGYEVFHNNAISFTPNLNMATPRDYVVGPGDELVVQIYGIAQATLNLKVSPEGKVVIPNVGVSHLGGLSIDAIKSLLTQKIGTRYAGLIGNNPSSYLMVTLLNIRSIKINIVGEVVKPGTYQLPSFTTTFNALYSAGGPNTKGSFRKIELFRMGKLITEIDLYDFLLDGKTDKNIRLEDNDVLLVPRIDKRVEIVGEVRRNQLFEIKNNETLTDLIKMSSGFNEIAYKKMITLQRYNGVDKSIINVTEKEYTTFKLEDGDYVIIDKTQDSYKNRVQITGSVLREGDYELKPNLRISDLIMLAGGLKPYAFMSRAILYRTGVDLSQSAISIDLNKAINNDAGNNLLLNKEDLLVVSNLNDLKENYYVTIHGDVNQPGAYPYSNGLTIKDLILKSNGFKESASGTFIELIRRVRNESNLNALVYNIQMDKELNITNKDSNLILQPFDQLYIRTSIGFKEIQKVIIQGEVSYPGEYILDKPNATIKELLTRSGGLLNSANTNGAILIRRTIYYKKNNINEDRITVLKELKSRLVDSTNSGYVQSNKFKEISTNNELNELSRNSTNTFDFSNDKYVSDINSGLKNKTDTQNKSTKFISMLQDIENIKLNLEANLFKNLKDVTVSENEYQFVSIQLDKIISNAKSEEFDLQLKDGDILYIPTYNETVDINGEVLYPISTKYLPGASLKKYVNEAGGFKTTALKSSSYVVQANGKVRRTHSFFGFKFYPLVTPGSHVFIPKNSKPKSEFSLDRILGLTSSLVTTYLLVQNLTK
jgi:protein involved in polysaccharide export with SLBB domain